MHFSTKLKCLVNLLLLFQCMAEEPEKPRFQVEHKSGKLNIQATKESAEIDSTEDFVDVVMKPGEQKSMGDDEAEQRHKTPNSTDSSVGQDLGDGGSKNSSIARNYTTPFTDFKDGWIKSANNFFKKRLAENKTVKVDEENTNQTIDKGLLEIEKEAAELANTMMHSAKDENGVSLIKETAHKLEEKVQQLNQTISESKRIHDADNNANQRNANSTVADANGETAPNTTSDKKSKHSKEDPDTSEDVDIKKNSKKIEDKESSGSEEKKPCPGCQKIPKAGDKPSEKNEELVPKLTKDEKSEGQNGTSNASIEENPKKIEDKESSGSKEKKPCPGCQKIPKAGDKPSEKNEELVPKLTKDEKSEGQNGTSNASIEENPKKIEDKESSGSKEKKPCPGCQKIPKAGDKPSEKNEELVPKLTKDEKSEGQNGTSNASEPVSFDLEDAEPTSEEKELMGNFRERNTSYAVLSNMTQINKASGDKYINNEKNLTVQTGRIEPNLKVDTESPTISKQLEANNRSAGNNEDRLTTLQEVKKVLGAFLNNSNLAEREELLKLTWHDLRINHAKNGSSIDDTKDDTAKTFHNVTIGKGNETAIKSYDLENIKQQSIVDGPIASNSSTAIGAPGSEEWMKTFVGRLKHKILLLRDAVDVKTQNKLKTNFRKKSPYEGFKRERISNKLDWLNARMAKLKAHK